MSRCRPFPGPPVSVPRGAAEMKLATSETEPHCTNWGKKGDTGVWVCSFQMPGRSSQTCISSRFSINLIQQRQVNVSLLAGNPVTCMHFSSLVTLYRGWSRASQLYWRLEQLIFQLPAKTTFHSRGCLNTFGIWRSRIATLTPLRRTPRGLLKVGNVISAKSTSALSNWTKGSSTFRSTSSAILKCFTESPTKTTSASLSAKLSQHNCQWLAIDSGLSKTGVAWLDKIYFFQQQSCNWASYISLLALLQLDITNR